MRREASALQLAWILCLDSICFARITDCSLFFFFHFSDFHSRNKFFAQTHHRCRDKTTSPSAPLFPICTNPSTPTRFQFYSPPPSPSIHSSSEDSSSSDPCSSDPCSSDSCSTDSCSIDSCSSGVCPWIPKPFSVGAWGCSPAPVSALSPPSV